MQTGIASPKCEQSSHARAAVLGAAAVDWVARVSELPQPDGIAWVSSYQAFPGGSGGNIAADLARLGVATHFLGKLGDDDGGHLLLADFIEAGVDVRGMRILRGQRSASCFIAVDDRGARQIYSLGGTALLEDPEELEPAWFNSVEALIITDAFPEVALAAVGFCPESAHIIYNPGGLMVSQPELWFEPMLSCHPILIVSRHEAQQLSSMTESISSTRYLLQRGFPVVIQTLGQRGAMLGYEENIYTISSELVPSVVDTTGAGDAFIAGFTAGMLDGMDWIQATSMGNLVAGLKVSQPGARAGIPNREEVNRLAQEDHLHIEEVML